MDYDTQLTGPQALARLLQRVRSAKPEELPQKIDLAGREIDLLLAHDGTQGAVVEYPVAVVIEICLLNFDQLTNWQKGFIPGVKRFSWLSSRQLYRLSQAALKFGVRPTQ